MTITAIPLPDALDALYGRLGIAMVAIEQGRHWEGQPPGKIIDRVRRDLSLLIDAFEKEPEREESEEA